MISEGTLASKIKAWQKTPAGQKRQNEYLDGLATTGGKTASGQVVVGVRQMSEAANLFIDILRRKLPEQISWVGSGLKATTPAKVGKAEYAVVIKFKSGDLYRESLDPDRYPDGLTNIVALFNNGYRSGHPVDYTYGWWDGHNPTGDAVYRSSGTGSAFVRSTKDRPALKFMQDAAAEFNAKYGAKYGVTVELGADYTDFYSVHTDG